MPQCWARPNKLSHPQSHHFFLRPGSQLTQLPASDPTHRPRGNCCRCFHCRPQTALAVWVGRGTSMGWGWEDQDCLLPASYPRTGHGAQGQENWS